MKTIAGYKIEDEDYAALAHGLTSPTEWIEHVVANFPPILAAEHIANKIEESMARWIADGKPTKTRAEREAEQDAAAAPSDDQIKTQQEVRLATLQATLAAAKQAGLTLAQAKLEKDIADIEACMNAEH